ncbi:MAG TPA: hypothetical protein VJ572_06115, partial [Azonexus sp.]|nr:hypothetical protein [Azonexus sp.]
MGQTPGKNVPVGRQLWIALVALAVGGLVLLAYVLWSGYREIWTEAQASARSHADLIEARFDATLRRVDSSLIELTSRISAESLQRDAVPRFRQQIEAEFERHRLAFPEVAGF